VGPAEAGSTYKDFINGRRVRLQQDLQNVRRAVQPLL
jgi:hypothetical protein